MGASPVDCIEDVALLTGERGPLSIRFTESFFNGKSPYVFVSKSGKEFFATFSFDTEIFPDRFMKIVYEDADLELKFRQLLAERKLDSLSVASVQKTLNLSDAQFQIFALRKGKAPVKGKISVADLNPSYAWSVIRSKNRNLIFQYLSQDELARRVSARLGFEVKVKPDGENIELVHPSFQTHPAQFKNEVNAIHKFFLEAQTHLHIGIPTEILDGENLLTIAKAVEAKIILQNVMAGASGKAAYEVSYLDIIELKKGDLRGFINIKVNQFKSPHLSHDVEVREWTKLEAGYENIATFAYLTKHQDRLIVVPREVYSSFAKDDVTINLKGALGYIGYLLKLSDELEVSNVGRELFKLYDEIGSEVSDEMRDKVRAYLREADVESLLNSELFLNAPQLH